MLFQCDEDGWISSLVFHQEHFYEQDTENMQNNFCNVLYYFITILVNGNFHLSLIQFPHQSSTLYLYPHNLNFHIVRNQSSFHFLNLLFLFSIILFFVVITFAWWSNYQYIMSVLLLSYVILSFEKAIEQFQILNKWVCTIYRIC